MSKKSYAVLVGLLLAGSFYFFGFHPKSSVKAQREGHLDARGHETALWRLRPGEQLLYSLRYSGRSGQQSYELRSDLSLTALAPAEGGYRVWLRLENLEAPRFSEGLGPQEALLGDLKVGRALHLGERGFQLEIPSSEGGASAADAFWKSFSERTRVALPPHIADSSFIARETFDGTPREAHYEQDDRSREGEGLRLSKTVGAGDAAYRLRSSIVLAAGEQGFQSLETTVEESLHLGSTTLPIESRLGLDLKNTVSLSATELAALTQASQRSGAREGGALAIQRRALGDASWSEIAAAISAAKPWPQALYLKVKAWIAVHPESLQGLLALLEAADADSELLRQGIKALAAVGHAEAQAALVSLLEASRENVAIQKRVVTSLGFAGIASPSTLEALRNIRATATDEALRVRADLSLGIIARKLRDVPGDDNHKAAAELEAYAWQRLRAGSPSEQKEALSALGNMGPRDNEALAPWLKSPDPTIRSQAYFALRFAAASSASQALISGLSSETQEDVRRTILSALTLRPIDAAWIQGIKQFAASPASQGLERELARILARRADAMGDQALPLLSSLRERTQDAALRQTIQAYETQAKQIVSR